MDYPVDRLGQIRHPHLLERILLAFSITPTAFFAIPTLSNPAILFYEIRNHSIISNIVDIQFDRLMSQPLSLVRPKRSTDPRDKAYGLYGIFDYIEMEDLPPVDYTEFVQQVY
ncbi:hypothetical protein E8E12_003987 [Didymella heteroderae]|uniref:Uncharacterized protein n=1 Tax=Didymella heteroderae TaxID=1769908 RepID=A0A9P5BYD3_9PLEO|nr:hypothetical protein E8E12_003987 [Didymella heteroderae]